jgi:hypothetical protein
MVWCLVRPVTEGMCTGKKKLAYALILVILGSWCARVLQYLNAQRMHCEDALVAEGLMH